MIIPSELEAQILRYHHVESGVSAPRPPAARAPWRRDAGAGRDEQAAALISCGDQLEQHAGLGLILADIREVVEDEQVVLVELVDDAGEREVAPRGLQPLHHVGGAGEQDAIPFSIRVWPRAAARCDLPTPGGPNASRLAPYRSHRRPAR